MEKVVINEEFIDRRLNVLKIDTRLKLSRPESEAMPDRYDQQECALVFVSYFSHQCIILLTSFYDRLLKY